MPNINTVLLGLLGVFWALIATLFGVVYQGLRREIDFLRSEHKAACGLLEDHIAEAHKEFREIAEWRVKTDQEKIAVARREDQHSGKIDDIADRLKAYEAGLRDGARRRETA